MEVERNEPDAPVDDETVHEPWEAEKEKTSKTNSTEKNQISNAINDHQEGKNDVESRQELTKKTKQDSFKKPTLLIGPRRGKAGQLRAVFDGNLKDVVKPSDQSGGQPDEITVDHNEQNYLQSQKSRSVTIDKQQIPLHYKEPGWGGLPLSKYKIEVLKSGVILHTIDIYEKSFYVIGRLPTCDISLAHPTISRYHAILQYRLAENDKQSKGFYLYDLESTHGTFWNGCRVRPNTFIKVQGGHMIRFGCSQRKFILQAPPDDVEEESDLTVTELKEKRRLDMLERKRMEEEWKKSEEEQERRRLQKEEEEGINWGMSEDADEETDLTENPYALTNNEELFLNDPKKTLRGWFEREGLDLLYETEEKGIGQFLCWVDLPLDTATGRAVRAEALVKGKKKEAVIQCALEACRILDRHSVLRQATHEARKRKSRNWEEEDFYDSDEDNFLDRTGAVEKKREKRMRQAGKLEDQVETHASLLEKHTAVTKKMVEVQNRLKNPQALKGAAMDNTNEDALDAFMSSLNSTVLNTAELTKMKLELQALRKEEERLLKLVNITKPANLPSLISQNISTDIPKFDLNAETIEISNASRKRVNDLDSYSGSDKRSSAVVQESFCKEENKRNIFTANGETSDTFTASILKDETGFIENKTKDVNALITENQAYTNSLETLTEESKRPNIETERNANEIVKKKKKNFKRIQQRADKVAKETSKGYEDDVYSEDYSMWLPPVNQIGDGKTNLNDKYGY